MTAADNINQKLHDLKNTILILRKSVFHFIHFDKNQVSADNQTTRWQYFSKISSKLETLDNVHRSAQLSTVDYRVTRKPHHLNAVDKKINICLKIIEEIEDILLEAKLCS